MDTIKELQHNNMNILVGRNPQKYWVLLHTLVHVIILQLLTEDYIVYSERLKLRKKWEYG